MFMHSLIPNRHFPLQLLILFQTPLLLLKLFHNPFQSLLLVVTQLYQNSNKETFHSHFPMKSPQFIQQDWLQFYVILSIHCLHSYYSLVNYRTRDIKIKFLKKLIIEWRVSISMPVGKFVLYLKAIRIITKGFIYNLFPVKDSKSNTPTPNSVPIMNKFPKVFPKDLPKDPPKQEIHFGIDLLLSQFHLIKSLQLSL